MRWVRGRGGVEGSASGPFGGGEGCLLALIDACAMGHVRYALTPCGICGVGTTTVRSAKRSVA